MVDTKSGSFRILALDGGGSKGVYSLGFLKQLEVHLGVKTLSSSFDLIYGTSTGAIIAALLGLGCSVDEISELYFEIIPKVMPHSSSQRRSAELVKVAEGVFQDRKFDAFETRVAIVATNYDFNRAAIFKSDGSQAYGMLGAFKPGFGCRIADAVVASSAAIPFFEKHVVETETQGSVRLIDGGFVANNPSLYALTDATNSLKIPRNEIRLLSVGVGRYKQAALKMTLLEKAKYKFLQMNFPVDVLETTLSASANSTEYFVQFLFPDVHYERVNDALTENGFETHLLESETRKLNMMFNHGQSSFGRHEKRVAKLFF